MNEIVEIQENGPAIKVMIDSAPATSSASEQSTLAPTAVIAPKEVKNDQPPPANDWKQINCKCCGQQLEKVQFEHLAPKMCQFCGGPVVGRSRLLAKAHSSMIFGVFALIILVFAQIILWSGPLFKVGISFLIILIPGYAVAAVGLMRGVGALFLSSKVDEDHIGVKPSSIYRVYAFIAVLFNAVLFLPLLVAFILPLVNQYRHQ